MDRPKVKSGPQLSEVTVTAPLVAGAQSYELVLEALSAASPGPGMGAAGKTRVLMARLAAATPSIVIPAEHLVGLSDGVTGKARMRALLGDGHWGPWSPETNVFRPYPSPKKEVIKPAVPAAAAAQPDLPLPSYNVAFSAPGMLPSGGESFRKMPAELAFMPDGSLLVADHTGGPALQLYNDRAQPLPAHTEGACAVVPVTSTSPDGSPQLAGFVVVHATRKSVSFLQPDGDVVWQTPLNEPWAAAVVTSLAQPAVLVTDGKLGVVVLDLSSGVTLHSFGKTVLVKPRGIAVTLDCLPGFERVFVSCKDQISVFTLLGEHTATLVCRHPLQSLWGLAVNSTFLVACNLGQNELVVMPLPPPNTRGAVTLDCAAVVALRSQPRGVTITSANLLAISLNTPPGICMAHPVA